MKNFLGAVPYVIAFLLIILFQECHEGGQGWARPVQLVLGALIIGYWLSVVLNKK